MFHFRTGVALRADCGCISSGDCWVNKNCHLRKHIKKRRTRFFISPNTVMLLFQLFHSSVVSTEWFLQGMLNPWAVAASACSEVKDPNLPQTQRSSRARPCSCCVWMSHMVTDFWVPEKQQILLFILERMWTFQSASNRGCCGARRDVWNLN